MHESASASPSSCYAVLYCSSWSLQLYFVKMTYTVQIEQVHIYGTNSCVGSFQSLAGIMYLMPMHSSPALFLKKIPWLGHYIQFIVNDDHTQPYNTIMTCTQQHCRKDLYTRQANYLLQHSVLKQDKASIQIKAGHYSRCTCKTSINSCLLNRDDYKLL